MPAPVPTREWVLGEGHRDTSRIGEQADGAVREAGGGNTETDVPFTGSG
jgi:hypothetical protein